MELIDKASVVAKIDSMLKSVEHTSHCDEISFNSGRWKALTSIKDFLNTIEVKEVDIEKELNDYGYHYDYVSLADRKELVDFAKHFFELGMAVSNKAQKGE